MLTYTSKYCQHFSVSNSHNTGTDTHSTSGCPSIVSRSEWHARAPAHHIGPLPAVPGNVYIHHGATPGCYTKADCIKLVQSYQNYHMDTHRKELSTLITYVKAQSTTLPIKFIFPSRSIKSLIYPLLYVIVVIGKQDIKMYRIED